MAALHLVRVALLALEGKDVYLCDEASLVRGMPLPLRGRALGIERYVPENDVVARLNAPAEGLDVLVVLVWLVYFNRTAFYGIISGGGCF
ncbi:hypothetical protein JW711_03235 [Candidatus Woesearchaeota archaeon]|nr:hypothetical protein [Candidatus Woesearchaeota archaeon]